MSGEKELKATYITGEVTPGVHARIVAALASIVPPGSLQITTAEIAQEDLGSTENLAQEITVAAPNLPYSLDEITKPELFLVREHFEEFRKHQASQFSGRIATRAFGFLVSQHTARKYSRYPLYPDDFGLFVTTRERIKFPPALVNQTQPISRYAVKVGSFLTAEKTGGNEKWDSVKGLSDNQHEFLHGVAEYLKPRLEDIE